MSTDQDQITLPGGPFGVPTPARGNDTPTVSFNLTGVNDWSVQMPFLDVAKMMRPWIGHEPGQWGGMDTDELRAGGYLDAQGWVTAIPEGIAAVGNMWAWGAESASESRAGTYVMTYEGEGEISLRGATVLSQENGRIVFETAATGNMWMTISETDPQGTGDYIRNISVVREDHLELHEAGAIFNPDWLDLVSNSREFRFMDWMGTNSSTLESWDDRPRPEDATWSGNVPVEIMVQLANEAGVDPWFTMPHMADDDYVRNFAEYVRDHLDPDLTARVEYSNEIWNFAFSQTHWMRDQAAAEWGDTSGTAYLDYQIMRATQVGLIWEEVFSETETAPALVNVLGVQTVNEWAANRLLTAATWQAQDPDGFVEPALVFDELAVTTYFGSPIVSDSAVRAELLAAIADPEVDATAWLTAKLLDPDQRLSIPSLLTELQQMKAVADQYGLDMVAYEGGQHVHHSFAVGGLTEDQVQALTGFMTDYVRSPDMAMLYEELWDLWAQVSDGAFMQFGDVGTPGRFGSWAILDALDDTNPRAEFLFEQMETATPWWDTEANAAYLHGVTRTGTDAADTMTGTDAEDYLAGGAGDDGFVVGAGRDGINGGAGSDTLYLRGDAGDYTIRAQGEGHLISGPYGDKFVINLENFAFESGQTLSLEDLMEVRGPDAREGRVIITPHIDQVLDMTGTVLDAEGTTDAAIADPATATDGVVARGIGGNNQLGKEIGLSTDTSDIAYVIHERKDQITVEDDAGMLQTYTAWRYAVLENTNGPDGTAITDSASQTALSFGDVVRNPASLTLTSQDDLFLGRYEDDVVFGAGGNDILRGRRGDDTLDGGAGDDLIVGNSGNDLLAGGAGADRFYLHAGAGQDRIIDFDVEDSLLLNDYLSEGQTLADAAALDAEGHLVVSNGTDQVTFEGLDLSALSWIDVA